MKKLRTWVPTALAAVIVVVLATMWWQSRLPASYSVMDMGYEDLGGGPPVASHHGRSVTDLVADPGRKADATFDLVARQQRFQLADGREVDGYTVNGTSPGPTLRVVEGQLVAVTLRNQDVADGASLHWHGVEVPNAEDGVAGVTQDNVPVGGSRTYRFVANHAGTFWYHSHQLSHRQVRLGLFGTLVVEPVRPGVERDALAVAHVYDGLATVNGRTGTDTVPARPGEKVRVRVVNTDNGSLDAWVSGSPYRVLAMDGYDLNGPTTVTDRSVLVTAGGRADLEVVAPARIELGATALVVGDAVAETRQPAKRLDLLSYGAPKALPFDPTRADRSFRYHLGRKPGFIAGKPGLWWSVNGGLFPDVPMFVVAEGDVVRMTIRNRSFDTHPMHLHGHHAVVLSRDGVKATGTPWWVDSLDVAHGETYEIAFLADNPGIWMDHCHNLPHAKEGLVAHLMYDGVSTPFRVKGEADNQPE